MNFRTLLIAAATDTTPGVTSGCAVGVGRFATGRGAAGSCAVAQTETTSSAPARRFLTFMS